MERVQYVVGEPCPSLPTLNQLLCGHSAPQLCKETEITRYLGSSACTGDDWTTEPIDYYFQGIEFATVERLDRGIVRCAGTFGIVSNEDKYVVLKDRLGRQFYHPKWTVKTVSGSSQYRTTATRLWTGYCICERTSDSSTFQGICICEQVLDISCWKCRKENGICKRVADYLQKQAETEAEQLEVTLSQNICLCSTLFHDGHQCYCGFSKPETTETTKSDPTESKGTGQEVGSSRTKQPAPHEANNAHTAKRSRRVAADVEADIFDKVALFIEKEASMGLIAFERGDTNLQLHIQGVMSLQASSVRSIKTDLTKAIGWDTNAPVGGVVCIKSVKNQGLHTVTGLIGYCLKDENELHFRLYSKNVTEEQMEEGRKRHMVFGASGYKNRLELTPQNLLCRALQFRRYRSKNPVTTSFRHCIRDMARSGQYMAGLKWLLSPTVCNVRAERLWMFAVQPEAVNMADVDHIFFNFQNTARYYEGRRLQSDEEVGADKPSEKELPKRYRTEKPPERSEAAESVWTEPHPKDFIDVDLQTLDPEEMQRLLKAGFGLTNRTVIPGRETSREEDEAEDFINFL
ncbi:hypothetical protein R1sor_019814 [Riccia sorocarpa]|uniref:Replitron HUH endonuclease domain-containing protein n=1 Tax=Riccia sorocarpa TaxID=122646 RepID=A0ABD3IDR0_9MARC